ncbi:MAG: hypothetical protein ACE5IW_04810 [bacterium]
MSAFLFLGVHDLDLYSTPMDSNSGVRLINITSTENLLEIKPRFIENGRSVLFLVFSGDYLSPKPWDYRLSKSDREGQAVDYLTPNGVLDYNVLPDEHGILVLKARSGLEMDETDFDFYDDLQGWELWYFNLQSSEMVLLEASTELPISVGYYMLGLGMLPDFDSDEFLVSSPKETAQIIIRRHKKEDLSYFRFCHPDSIDNDGILFETEAWKSYSDTPWWPTITWLDENNFVTVSFESNEDCHITQYEGLFSIVKVDLQSKSREVLFQDLLLSPFPKIVLDPSATFLYFQRMGEDKEITELWSLNLKTKSSEMIYKVKGELGEVRFSLDGSSLIFTQFEGNNFDIICLDLDINKIHRLAGK